MLALSSQGTNPHVSESSWLVSVTLCYSHGMPDRTTFVRRDWFVRVSQCSLSARDGEVAAGSDPFVVVRV